MRQRLKSHTAGGMNGYRRFSKSWLNWLTSADEFVPWNR